MEGKVRKRVYLDSDIVEALSEDPRGLSIAVNEALREEVERRRRMAALEAVSVQ